MKRKVHNWSCTCCSILWLFHVVVAVQKKQKRSNWERDIRCILRAGGVWVRLNLGQYGNWISNKLFMLVLSILERQILCESGWKMPGLHSKIFFSPFLPNNIQTHFLSYFFFHYFPFTLFHLQPNIAYGHRKFKLCTLWNVNPWKVM